MDTQCSAVEDLLPFQDIVSIASDCPVRTGGLGTGTGVFRESEELKVFLVDDSAIIRQRITTLLQDFPQLEITGQFDTDAEAIQSISQTPPDAILLDLELGSTNTNGLNVLHYASRHFPSIKVIILTNHSDGLTRSQCLKAGAYLFLDKTLEFDKVPNVLLTAFP